MLKKYSEKLEAIEWTISRSKLSRVLSRPLKYIIGQSFRHIGFPFFGWSRIKKIATICSDSFYIVLPAGLDIYLWGCKTHDSELRLTKYLIRHLKPGHVFIDVGAHFGFYTSLAADLVEKDGRVFAFEPTPKTFDILKKNTKLSNTAIFNKAVGSENGSITFYEYDQLHSEYNSTIPVEGLSSNEFSVELMRLDTFAERQKIKPNIIKVDVEGAEHAVVKGLENLYSRADFDLVLEIFSESKKNKQQIKAAGLLHTLGFAPYSIDKNGDLVKISSLSGYLSSLSMESDNIVFRTS